MLHRKINGQISVALRSSMHRGKLQDHIAGVSTVRTQVLFWRGKTLSNIYSTP